MFTTHKPDRRIRKSSRDMHGGNHLFTDDPRYSNIE